MGKKVLKQSDSIETAIEQYEKKIYDQRQLIDISKALNSTLDYKYLIDAILNICLAQLQTLKAAIYLAPDVDADHFTLDLSHKGFEFSKEDESKKIMIDSPLIHFFEQRPKAITLNKLEENDSIPNSEIDYFKNHGVELMVPLSAKGKVNGLLVLGEKMSMSDFEESEKDFLSTLAGLAGIAVENSRLYELATVDMMTQLKIHHYFQSKLREEMDRCRKKNSKLALLFTDVDKFKVFNDTYGHQAGDVVLIEVAKKLIESARKNDIPARYGGEEFCVVMPGASMEEGFEMGEKIRKAIESTVVKNPNTGEDLRVTISVGVTEFHPNDKNNKELIERADKALYQAKHGGRNRTVCL
ncbi:MAG: sensor domain-containing diguanylate cyclase [Leptospiraceae bacterium]|nr:sensor domain-containing diguanylate cyclase [Leptospiraceae bacterium]MCK6381627.1 sensor domain-containing diguanylate cyclase [Leptospiraceae bacterium]NUM40814.1 sensor domain-containing diguanylate cyclase [Leptospiraceae bacterium]